MVVELTIAIAVGSALGKYIERILAFVESKIFG